MAATATLPVTLQGAAELLVTDSFAIAWVSQLRNATTATTVNTYTSDTDNSIAIRASYQSPRVGVRADCNRTFLFFDVSTITNIGTITSATVKILGYASNTSTDTIIVEGSAWNQDGSTTTLATSDFNNLDFNTAYSSKSLSWSGLGVYNTYSLNATAISDMNTNGYLNCVAIEADYDYDGQAPSLGTSQLAGVTFEDPIKGISIQVGYTLNPLKWPENLNNVLSAAIQKINGTLSSAIVRVIDSPQPGQDWVVNDATVLASKDITSLVNGASTSTENITLLPHVDAGGTRLYVPEYGNKKIRQLSIATANDISSTISNVGVSPALGYNFTDFTLSDDGTKAFVLTSGSGVISQYTVSTAWNISTMGTIPTATVTATIPAGFGVRQAAGISFDSSGFELYTVTQQSTVQSYINSWTLSTKYSISTAGSENITNNLQIGQKNMQSVQVLESGSAKYVVVTTSGTTKQHSYKNDIYTSIDSEGNFPTDAYISRYGSTNNIHQYTLVWTSQNPNRVLTLHSELINL
jgi:hypothetical protein